ncbi:MAG TPA: DEAD/DEAH box helicase [Vicinamibacterales bacterium]|nr:DEAD/DEAH box helicase [Vicinamibacterales bacterium]
MPQLLSGVHDRQFEQTTPIQSAVIPIALARQDVIGCAATGTGKTLAFLLPAFQHLLNSDAEARLKPGTTTTSRTRMLVLAPTRELCVQIEDDVQGLIYHTPLTSVAIYGGVPMNPQSRALEAGVDIVVATPGRLIDHMRTGGVNGFNFDGIEILVLDEADRMMDMGFWPDVRRIVAALPPADKRQTLLFSATMPAEMMAQAREITRDAKYLQVGAAGAPAVTITHTVQQVSSSGEKVEWLIKFLKRTGGPVLIFARTKIGAERLARRLQSAGLPTASLHADRTQPQRTAAIEGFRAGRFRVLVATDVAARGIDVDGISHVVNFEVPTDLDAYVHRVGRTGRAEATGTALTLVAPEERRALAALEQTFNLKLHGGPERPARHGGAEPSALQS